jgi:uncharacterized protein (TIGR00303 family)
MNFLSEIPSVTFRRPLFCSILANTILSTIPGISGAGPTPDKTFLTPILDAELITRGAITSMPVKPNTPTGCPTPASITRAMAELSGIRPLFINAGLNAIPTVPCLDVYGTIGEDPRFSDAVPRAQDLYTNGEAIGSFLSQCGDLLVLGECVPGGTTTALCVLRALGYDASVSSSFASNPVNEKEKIWNDVKKRVQGFSSMSPLEIVRCTGDPMIPVAAGIASAFKGELLLAGGTQMLSVAAVTKAIGGRLPRVVTTCYVRDDPAANVQSIADQIGVCMYYIDPGFGDLGHSGLARYCIGEVKEGMGAGGAMCLAYLLGYSPDEIRQKILATVTSYC